MAQRSAHHIDAIQVAATRALAMALVVVTHIAHEGADSGRG
jgi:hypothetical protein